MSPLNREPPSAASLPTHKPAIFRVPPPVPPVRMSGPYASELPLVLP